MRMINELVIRGEPSEINKLIDLLKYQELRSEDWSRDQLLENRVEVMVGTAPGGVLCLTWRGSSVVPPASVFLRKQGEDELALLNIVPTRQMNLSDEEYNQILSRFEQDLLGPISKGLRIETIVVPPYKQIESSLSPEVFRRLKSFASRSRNANGHFFDWKEWDQFLVQVYQDGLYLSDSDLSLLLESQGWSAHQLTPFVDHFREGQSLLAAYDEERATS